MDDFKEEQNSVKKQVAEIISQTEQMIQLVSLITTKKNQTLSIQRFATTLFAILGLIIVILLVK